MEVAHELGLAVGCRKQLKHARGFKVASHKKTEQTQLEKNIGNMSRRRYPPKLCGAVFGSLALLVNIRAQGLTGEIRLEVKDPSGAAMRASGTLENLQTGAMRTFVTDENGVYTFENLSYGRYRLEISSSGFATQSLSVEVQSNRLITRSVTMSLRAQAVAVDVVATTPLAGTDRSIEEIPAPVQAASQREIGQSGAVDLSDFLNRRLDSVYLNEVQGNPFQPDLNYRGYTASPLLGTPQGVSVYMDGVRLNQPFGDVVSWDLIPRIAISEVALLPGSNPLFGLNTLGGALSLQTKDGRSDPGTSVEAYGGSYGRRAVEFEHGGAIHKGLNWYASGNLFHDDGWRVDSPSDVRQSFAKIGWQQGKTFVSVTGAYADNELRGNGLQEQRFLSRDYASIYTKPDITNNRSPFLNFNARENVSSSLTFFGNAYFRYIRTDTFNADLNDDSLDQSVYQPSAAEIQALMRAGYTGFPTSGANASNTPFPFWRCIAQALLQDEPSEKCNGLLRHTYTKQHNWGGAGQMSWSASPLGRRNQFIVGAGVDYSSATFQQSGQFGYLNPDRSVTPVNAFLDGSTNADGQPVDARVNLHGLIHTGSLYAMDSVSLGRNVSLVVAGRYNRATINNRDRINPGGGPRSLDGHYVFGRFNPAAGATFSPWRLVTAYVSYSESSRAPTSIELGCADPANPCNLPNALVSDPPLKQVTTGTWEAGLRSSGESRLRWTAGWFRAVNHNDILFVASEQTGNGYFKNFGETLRQGVEVNVSSRIGRITLGGGYTFLDATYQTAELIGGSSNSANDAALAGRKGVDGNIQITPGDQIPLVPHHMLKAFADAQVTAKFALDIDFIAVSRSYARGNENNLSQPDGVYYLGPGTSPGYGVVNLGGRYQAHRKVQLFAQIDNLLNHRYYTAAQLAPTGFGDSGSFIARPLPAVNGDFPVVHATFYAPGAPLRASGGVRLSF